MIITQKMNVFHKGFMINTQMKYMYDACLVRVKEMAHVLVGRGGFISFTWWIQALSCKPEKTLHNYLSKPMLQFDWYGQTVDENSRGHNMFEDNF